MLINEHEYPYEQANAIWQSAVDALNFNYTIQTFGSPPIITTMCTLKDKKTGERIKRGFGKGLGQQTELSAKYEALENYTSIVSNTNKECVYYSIHDIQNKNIDIFNDYVPPALFENEKLKHLQLPWVEFSQHSSDNKVLIPAISVNPEYAENPFPEDRLDYKNLYLPLTNNGTAIGCSHSASLIHCLSEIIERDAISFFLLRSFVKSKPNKIELININSIPKFYQELIVSIEKQTEFKLRLFRMPNDCDIPAYGAVLVHQDLSIPIKGFACSLDSNYAIERTLLEVTEQYHVYNEDFGPAYEDQLAYDIFEEWPVLKRCVQFDIDNTIEENGFLDVEYQESKINIDNIDEYLACLIQKIHNAGFTIYTTELFSFEKVKTMQAIIPEAEDFFSVLKGVVKVPGPRGKHLLQNGSA